MAVRGGVNGGPTRLGIGIGGLSPVAGLLAVLMLLLRGRDPLVGMKIPLVLTLLTHLGLLELLLMLRRHSVLLLLLLTWRHSPRHVLLRRISMLRLLLLLRVAILLLLLLLAGMALLLIKIRIVSLIGIVLVTHVHGGGHVIPVALVHEIWIPAHATRPPSPNVHAVQMLLLGVAAVGSPHLEVLLLLLLLLKVPPAQATRHLRLRNRQLSLLARRRWLLGGSRALAIGRTHSTLALLCRIRNDCIQDGGSEKVTLEHYAQILEKGSNRCGG